MKDMTVQGEVAPGFEPVRDTLTQYAADVGDGGCAFAACVGGRKVVDIWVGTAGDGPWREDTTAQFMSTTKPMTALCIQLLVDRGQLDITAPIADVWPEFAAAGKQAITIADVLCHRSGVVGGPAVTALINLDDGTGWDRTDEITAALAATAPFWEPGSQMGYHTTSYGWILGEVIRRVDGRDLGTFFREEVAKPLGVDLGIGVPESEFHRIAPVLPLLWPDSLTPELRAYFEMFFALARDDSTAAGVSCQASHGVGVLDRLPEAFNNPPGRTAPLGGSNLTGTARDVAKVFAMLADPAGIDGVQLVSAASLATFTEIHEARDDIVLLVPLSRGLGYVRNIAPPGRPQAFGPHEEAFGHGGVGGQLGFADPVSRVGAAFVRNHYTVFPMLPLLLTGALYQSLS